MPDDIGGTGGPANLSALQLASDRRLSMMALGLIAAPALWFARNETGLALDLSALDGAYLFRAAAALIPVTGIALVATARDRAALSRVILLTAISIATAYVFAAWIYGPATPIRTPLLALGVLYVGLPNSLWRQIGPAIFMSLGLLAFDALPLAVAAGSLATGVLAFIAFNALGCLAVARRLQLECRVEQAWRLEQDARFAAERAVSELDQLRGIIPICSHCQRVRTEVGSWQQLEQYVRDRSGADFSHGVCPSCFKVHYPEISA